MTVDRGPSFWSEQCPARGPGLTHAHDKDCETHCYPVKHARTQCCECGEDRLKAGDAMRDGDRVACPACEGNGRWHPDTGSVCTIVAPTEDHAITTCPLCRGTRFVTFRATDSL